MYSHEDCANEIIKMKYWIIASIINCFLSFSSNFSDSLVLHRNNFYFIRISCCTYIIHFETEMFVFKKGDNIRLWCFGRKNHWQEIWDSSKEDSSRQSWNRYNCWVHGDISYYLEYWLEYIICWLKHCLHF